ncbi:MAG: hypothetical protein BWK75_02225 [Candidatus Altiarchaeales archaeon A3]|nr:MAG: hypothetical protein BWK75_02225 [Candidatus Altiarchaeales archaeon A3]
MEGFIFATIGAGLAVGLPALGSAIGSGIAGASASGVIAEKKEMFVTGLIFEALPQTAVIFGFVIAVMIVGGIKEDLSLLAGIKMLGAGIAMGIAGLTPVAQASVLAAGIGSTARAPATKVNNIVYAAIPDLSVIMGFVVAFLLISG